MKTVIDLSLRIMLSCAAAYSASLYIHALEFPSALALGQFVFLLSLIVVPLHWLRLMRPADIEAIRSQVSEEDARISCIRASLSQNCILQVGSKFRVVTFLEMIDIRAVRRARQFEEELWREIFAPGFVLAAVFILSYYKTKYFPSNTVTDPVIGFAEVGASFSFFAFYIGRLYGEVVTERKLNIAASEML